MGHFEGSLTKETNMGSRQQKNKKDINTATKQKLTKFTV